MSLKTSNQRGRKFPNFSLLDEPAVTSNTTATLLVQASGESRRLLVFSVLATFYKRLATNDSLELQRRLHSLQVQERKAQQLRETYHKRLTGCDRALA